MSIWDLCRKLGEDEQTLMLGIYPDIIWQWMGKNLTPWNTIVGGSQVDQSQLRFEIAAPLTLMIAPPRYSLLNCGICRERAGHAGDCCGSNCQRRLISIVGL